MAGLPLPPRADYEDFPQQENGVGSIRAFLESLDQASNELPQAVSRSQALQLGGGKHREERLATGRPAAQCCGGSEPAAVWFAKPVLGTRPSGDGLTDGSRPSRWLDRDKIWGMSSCFPR